MMMVFEDRYGIDIKIAMINKIRMKPNYFGDPLIFNQVSSLGQSFVFQYLSFAGMWLETNVISIHC